MKIQRMINGKMQEIELTKEEIYQAAHFAKEEWAGSLKAAHVKLNEERNAEKRKEES